MDLRIHTCTGFGRALLIVATTTSLVIARPVAAAEPSAGVFVNGARLPAKTVAELERAYGVPIAPGRYWYDRVSGAWGAEGGPIAGQMMPGLPLGGTLRADASRGNTRVFINGRELTMSEVMGLQRACATAVHRGRYWVNAAGVGGYEGGPPIFDLAACGRGSGRTGSSTRTYCDSAGNCSSHGLWGWVSTSR